MYGPAKRWPKLPGEPTIPRQMHAERRELLSIMIAGCCAAGVDFLFETEIMADMVIDAAGWQSPVRMGLPEDFLIPAQLGHTQIFYAWRGYLDRLPGPEPECRYKNYLGHRSRKGFSWIIANSDSMDVLLGNIGQPLTQEDIAEGLAAGSAVPARADRHGRGEGPQRRRKSADTQSRPLAAGLPAGENGQPQRENQGSRSAHTGGI